MPLRVHDTRRRDKVDFSTMNPGIVNMYVCGVTVYDLCHLGHARCYLSFDMIHRWLEKSGYDVNYVQNFTDIDDKIINRANETGSDWKQLVDENIESYYHDMDSLNILKKVLVMKIIQIFTKTLIQSNTINHRRKKT